MGKKKRRIARITNVFGLLWMVTLVFARPAQAYLDPGTGSYIVQIIVASLLGVGLFMKSFWMSIKSILGKYFSKFQGSGEDNDEEK